MPAMDAVEVADGKRDRTGRRATEITRCTHASPAAAKRWFRAAVFTLEKGSF
jgi:hypothetical protein